MQNLEARYNRESENGMLDVVEVAEVLHCSTRHVYRMVDSGQMPRPVKLGGLNRWPWETLGAWIRNGCPGNQYPKK